MKIPFHKMHGAGNDFIVVDDRDRTFPMNDTGFVRAVCRRQTGIGSDGIILLQPSVEADLRMRFLNPDGNEVDMCGNGARCFARFAFDMDAVREKMTIETNAGLLHAEVLDALIRIDLTEPSGVESDLSVGMEMPVDFINTGVPHAVVRVDDLDKVNVQQLGSTLRYHERFAPEGTNANFIHVESDGMLSARTYERGVENETLACGTGAAAAALVAAHHGWVELPVAVHCASGYDLTINSVGGKVTLTGNAEYVFTGEMEYGDRV
jgi:diaminopimelate epimerase